LSSAFFKLEKKREAIEKATLNKEDEETIAKYKAYLQEIEK
jgi:hypothetical protein